MCLDPSTTTITLGQIYARRASKRSLSSLATALRTNALIDIHPGVSGALHAQKPVIALGSTVIVHGIHYPVNQETVKLSSGTS